MDGWKGGYKDGWLDGWMIRWMKEKRRVSTDQKGSHKLNATVHFHSGQNFSRVSIKRKYIYWRQ